MTPRRRWLTVVAGSLAVAGGLWWWHDRNVAHFLTKPTDAYALTLDTPPAADSEITRRELDELLSIQAARSEADVDAARADRKTRIERFYGALGLDAASAPPLPRLKKLAQTVEDDVRIHARVAKQAFRRLRPYVIESRLQPCIDGVKDALSYPSGHAAYGWAMVGLLKLMVPEKADALERRGNEFARRRMVCGVHYSSDLVAGRYLAEALIEELVRLPAFRIELNEAAQELRGALRLPPVRGAN